MRFFNPLMIFLSALTVGILCFGQTVYAQDKGCPPNSDRFENPADGSFLCVVLDGDNANFVEPVEVLPHAQDDDIPQEQQEVAGMTDASAYYVETNAIEYDHAELLEAEKKIADYEKSERLHQAMADGGFMFDFGFGFGLPGGLDARASLGYMFASPNMTSGFSLTLDFYGMVHKPSYISLTLVPSYYLISGKFRFTMGLGVGFSKNLGDKLDHDYYLMFKPTLLFDWFVTERMFLGFGSELPFNLVQHKKGQSEEPKITFDLYFNMFFHFGFLF